MDRKGLKGYRPNAGKGDWLRSTSWSAWTSWAEGLASVLCNSDWAWLLQWHLWTRSDKQISRAETPHVSSIPSAHSWPTHLTNQMDLWQHLKPSSSDQGLISPPTSAGEALSSGEFPHVKLCWIMPNNQLQLQIRPISTRTFLRGRRWNSWAGRGWHSPCDQNPQTKMIALSPGDQD